MLDYILNKADQDEFEAIVKACERRRRDLSLFASIGGVNPERAARNTAQAVEGVHGGQPGRDSVHDPGLRGGHHPEERPGGDGGTARRAARLLRAGSGGARTRRGLSPCLRTPC
ncbi:MAG: hypothetical protein MZV70_06145 [Desulfobacterales bacterium]|nr:hypothetical protein [Desulfobacterales bacterium]